ncbi:M56 family metallopeptidase [Streptomyces sp. Ag109_O5-10]|uniref:M56 family metallopeptidase n=1 Tax=Streptomyces sp. Ag109_O5-10 TaxID=1855349 RepID=UPI000894526B|nr:M56 family metallopeptidase [Streptomyces sp. Ag109_O5-10]SEE30299.1 Peptidase family M48 [Streptomyces sp. Ag109_O5-10]
MLISVYIPFLVTAALAVLAPPVAHRLPPRPAALGLACAALVTAAGWAGSLALLAFTGVAQIPQIAEEGRWSVSALRSQDPVYAVVAAVSTLVLAVCVVSLGVAAVRQGRHLLRARRECAALPGHTELAVVDDDAPLAFALPGSPGRIVVSRGMLRRLGDAEREALLAHERAHLRGRHHVFQSVWRLTAALNPLLRPVAVAGDFVLERWADEEAAERVGDRTVVAHAVGRAALASAGASRPAALAATGGVVPQRVRALLAPPPARRRLPLLAGALLLAVCCASLANAASDSDRMLDSAQYALCRGQAGAATAAAAPTGHGDALGHGPEGCRAAPDRPDHAERHF